MLKDDASLAKLGIKEVGRCASGSWGRCSPSQADRVLFGGGFPLLQGQQITVSALCRRPACPEGRSLNAYIHRLQLIGTAGEIPKAPPANQIRFVEDMDESELAQAVSAEAGQHLLLLEHQADRRRYGPIDIQMKIPAGLQNMGNTVRYRKRLSSPHGQLRPMLT